MFNRNLIISMICVISSISGAFAAGDAGCGLGSMVFQKNSKLSQTFAATTNGTFSNQLLGITSGTSGCSASAIVKNDKAPLHFAEANLPQLQGELVRGEGEVLAAFAKTYGCSDSSVARFNAMTRDHAELLLGGDMSAQSVVSGVSTLIRSDAELSGACRISG